MLAFKILQQKSLDCVMFARRAIFSIYFYFLKERTSEEHFSNVRHSEIGKNKWTFLKRKTTATPKAELLFEINISLASQKI